MPGSPRLRHSHYLQRIAISQVRRACLENTHAPAIMTSIKTTAFIHHHRPTAACFMLSVARLTRAPRSAKHPLRSTPLIISETRCVAAAGVRQPQPLPARPNPRRLILHLQYAELRAEVMPASAGPEGARGGVHGRNTDGAGRSPPRPLVSSADCTISVTATRLGLDAARWTFNAAATDAGRTGQVIVWCWVGEEEAPG